MFACKWMAHLCHGVLMKTTGQLLGVSSLHCVGQGIELHLERYLVNPAHHF